MIQQNDVACKETIALLVLEKQGKLFGNINITGVTDNKTFWRIVGTFFALKLSLFL